MDAAMVYENSKSVPKKQESQRKGRYVALVVQKIGKRKLVQALPEQLCRFQQK